MTYTLTVPADGVVKLPAELLETSSRFMAHTKGKQLIIEPLEESTSDWDRAVQQNFLAGYDEKDSIYDSL